MTETTQTKYNTSVTIKECDQEMKQTHEINLAQTKLFLVFRKCCRQRIDTFLMLEFSFIFFEFVKSLMIFPPSRKFTSPTRASLATLYTKLF